jgi:hypothetical protein
MDFRFQPFAEYFLFRSSSVLSVASVVKYWLPVLMPKIPFHPARHHYLLRVEKKGRAGRFTRSQRFKPCAFPFFR